MHMPLHLVHSEMPQIGGVSQTPRLKANTMNIQGLGGLFAQEKAKMRRTISVHDLDYDLMGLS